MPAALQELKVERQVHAFEFRTVVRHEALERQIDFADEHAIVALVDDATQARDHILHLGAVGRVHRNLAVVRRAAGSVIRVRRVVAELDVLDEMPEHIDAEPIDPALHPETQHVVHRCAHVRVAPVEIGLALEKGVVVVLAARLVEFPGTAAELTQPVVRWTAIGRGVAPQIPVALLAASRDRASTNHGWRSEA